jgi:hypothetical protein
MAVVLKKKKAVKISKQAVKGILIKRFIRKGVIQDIEYLFDFES